MLPVPRSLRRKLPLLISALLIIVVASVCFEAYRQIDDVLVSATTLRLTSVTQQLAVMLGQSTHRSDNDLRRISSDSAIAAVLRNPTPSARTDAKRLLSGERDRNSRVNHQIVSYAILGIDGVPLLTDGPDFPIDHSLLRGVSERSPGTSSISGQTPGKVATGPFRIGHLTKAATGIAYSVATPVVSPTKQQTGWVIEYRRVASSQGTAQIGAIIGSSATLLIGNADGALWTDLTRVVTGPPKAARLGAAADYLNQAGARVLGVSAAIPTTPWLIAVQVPRTAVLAASTPFLAKIAAIGLLFIILGTLGAWLVSRWVTEPLGEMSRAAADFARGDYERRVTVDRNDELGDLAVAFNGMAARVGAAATELRLHATVLDAANRELRASEERIGSSERQFRALIENASDMISILDVTGRPRYVSPTQERLLGFTLEEIAHEPAFSLLHPDDIEGAAAAFAEILTRDGASFQMQFRRKHKDGTWRDISAVVTNLLNNPDVRGIVVNSHDVTDRQLLEAQLRQSQKMDAVGQLAGGVAHDFNNLLTVVTSCSAMLLADLPEDDPSRPEISDISEAARRAAALTRQLLAFSRRQVLEPRALDLNGLVGDLEKMLGRLLPDHVRLKTALGEYVASVYADPGQIEQVVLNLALNARDAMPDGGTLTIETAEVELDESYCEARTDVTPGHYIMLAVNDTGVGMDGSTQARIFDPFFTTKETGKGTGLGLSTVYGIVKQSGGHVGVYSEVGIGTTFKVYLPRARNAAGGSQRNDSQVALRRGTETVMLVEDDAQVRGAARRALTRSGYKVLEASSGREALTLCAEQTPHIDIVLTDMVMPGMSGREFASAIRMVYPDVAVAFMSGYTEDTLLRQGGVEPGTVFIHKPFTPESLTHKLREAIEASVLA